MTDVAIVVLEIINATYEGHVINGGAVTAGTASGRSHLGGVIFGVGRPVTSDATVTFTTIIDSNGNRTVSCVTGGTGIVLLIAVSCADKAGTGGHGGCVTAATFAVQAQVTGSRMIDIMISPVTTGVTGGTGPAARNRAADQGVGARIMTGGAAVMDLVVCRIGEGGRRINVTDQTGCFTGDEAGRDVINTVINIRNFRHVTGRTAHTGAGRDDSLNRQLNRGCIAVISIEVTGRTVIAVLGDDIGIGQKTAATVVVTDSATLLGRL